MHIEMEDLEVQMQGCKQIPFTPVFSQARVVHAVIYDMMPGVTVSAVEQIVDMFEMTDRSAFCNLYGQLNLCVLKEPGHLRDQHLSNIRKFLIQLTGFAEVHNSLDRLLFGKEG
jgi:hypothetical protein